MDQDFFAYLPSDIIINILSRLPIRATMSCKCVCKPWFDLLVTPEFVKSHLSKSVPGLAIFDWETQPKTNKIIEFVDAVDEHCWNVVFNFDLPFDSKVYVHSSANGLFFLFKEASPCEFFLCNPITREYITIPPPPPSSKHPFQMATYGFGVSRMSDQYKVVRMFLDEKLPLTPHIECEQYGCQVYTIGSGSWRRIASGSPLEYEDYMVGAFLNGNLHWLASNGSSLQISYLDLETELFSTFSPPPPPRLEDLVNHRNLSVLGDCLCVCDNLADASDYEIDIWLMKEYGDEKSWTKEFVIRKVDMDEFFGFIFPIKVFKDGGILMVLETCKLLYYSYKTNTIGEVDMYPGLDRDIFSCRTIYSPSFLPLEAFEMEYVSSF